MQGPSGINRPRTAGERAGSAGNSPDGVRDWQRNTWYGPAPLNSNPFDEPEDAPELKEIRSENVNEHIGSFWEPQGTGFTPRVDADRAGDVKTGTKRKSGGNSLIRVLTGIFVFLMAVVLILRFAVFSVREIQVIGNQTVPENEIIRESGGEISA